MNERYITELYRDTEELWLPEPLKCRGSRVHLLALGDVGANLLLGLKLLGGHVIDTIGIFDVNDRVARRYEMEMNQIGMPFSDDLPEVEIVTEEQLFDCDMFVFCASRGVPKIGESGDVRMMQLEANREIAEYYGRLAKKADFHGIFAVVSDPVDPLCKEALLSSGLRPAQIKGYGLGVMNRRAVYHAKSDEKYKSYLNDGRVFGPHGADLVVANSISGYDDELSMELTRLTIESNLKVRELGFKPFIAPAISSGAYSLIATLAGEWNYSSVWLGRDGDGAFLGIKNRIRNCGDNGAVGARVEFENLPLPKRLYERIEHAYENLRAL